MNVKILRYFVRGVEEIMKDLGRIKKVVVPKRREDPTPGRIDSVLRYLSHEYVLNGIALFDENGTLVASVGPVDDIRYVFNLSFGIIDELEPKYLFLRGKAGWITIFKRRGIYMVLSSSYKPDIVDLWSIGRNFEKYMWGSVWED